MFTSIYTPIAKLASWPLTFFENPEFIEAREALDCLEALEKAKEWPKTSNKQFAMRFLASHLENTSLKGSTSEVSAAYWCHLIELWLSEKGVFLPFEIDKSVLVELRDNLKDYGLSLDLYRSNSTPPDKAAEKILQGVQNQLKEKGYAYTCLGYRESPYNDGHAIPLHIDSNKWSSTVTVHFLNLGAGVHLHPEIEWDENSPRYHFRSLPITFSTKDFFGSRGIELFSRQLTLMRENLSQTTDSFQKPVGYSAYDVYGAFSLVGTMEKKFSSNVHIRSKKPQMGPTCADIAIELVIRDFLIEKSMSKIAIKRFFCNEKICTLLSFSHTLQTSKVRDDWVMFEKAVQAFSIKFLKKTNKILDEDEGQFCKKLIDCLVEIVSEGKKNTEVSPITPPTWLDCHTSTKFPSILDRSTTSLDLTSCDILLQPSIEGPSFEEICPPPKDVSEWLVYVLTFENFENDRLREFHFLFRVISQLPIPNPNKSGYWDEVSEKQIPDIIKKLSYLSYKCHITKTVMYELSYHQLEAFTLHTLYVISDHLMRRIHPTLNGFAPPFACIHMTEFCDGLASYQFPQIPIGQMHSRWLTICEYFESICSQNPSILFGFHSFDGNLDLSAGCKALKKDPRTKDPVACHLKFLGQFIEKSMECMRGEDLYALLWENEENAYLPIDFHYFQFIAQISWMKYVGVESHILNPKEPLQEIKRALNGSWRVKAWKTESKAMNRGSFKAEMHSSLSSHSRLNYQLEPFDCTSENEAMCSRPKEIASKRKNAVSTKTYQDWRRISIYPSLKIRSSIEWALDNLVQMREKFAMGALERALFALDSGLIKQLKETPYLLPRFYLLVDEGRRFFESSPNDLYPMLFFIRLGVTLDTFIQEAGYASDLSRLGKYEKHLLASIQKEKAQKNQFVLYQHLLFLYSVALPHKHQSLIEMIKANYWLAFNQNPDLWDLKGSNPCTPEWAAQQIAFLEDRYEPQLRTLSSEEINTLCQDIFALVLPNLTPPKKTWKGTYPLFHNEEYSLNLKECSIIRHKTEQLWAIKDASTGLHTLPGLKPLLEKTHYSLWVGKEGFDLQSEVFGLRSKEGNSESIDFCRQFTTETGTYWYRQIHSSHPLVHTFQLAGHYVWERIDKKGEIIVANQKTGTPRYLLMQDGEEFTVQKLGPKGQILPYQLVNNSDTDSIFFTRLGLKDHEALCWVSSSKQISFIELPSFNLNFQLENSEGEWRHYCLNIPGYFISKTQTLPQLSNFKGALVLENELGEKHVLIAATSFNRIDHDFSTEVVMSQETYWGSHTHPYYTFSVDDTLDMLLSKNPKSNLQLMLLFASMRDYPTALLYLEHGQKYGIHPTRLENKYPLLKDRSPEALAFYLRLGIYLFKNQSQLTKEQFERNRCNPEVAICAWISQRFSDYLRYASKEYSHIPAYIRLTPEEEGYLLTRLQSADSLPYLLQTRKTLLESKTIRYQRSPSNYSYFKKSFRCIPNIDIEQTFKTRRSIFYLDNSKPFNSGFVRINPKDISVHFPILYRRALKGDGELDLFYLSRSVDSSKYYNHLFLAHLTILYYVRSYPVEFEALSFGEDITENDLVFRKIRDTAIQLQKKTPTKKTSKVFQQSVLFDYSFEKPLSLDLTHTVSPAAWKFKPEIGEKLIAFHCSLQTEFLEHYVCIQTVSSIRDDRSFLFDTLPKTLAPTAALTRLVEAFQLGFKASQSTKRGRDLFTLKEDLTPKHCMTDAKDLLAKKKAELQTVRKKAEKLANRTPVAACVLGLRQHGKDLPKITIEGILTEALDREDPSVISAANPSLSVSEIQELLTLTMRYHILNCHIIQLTHGLKALKETGGIQEFGEALAVYGAFNPTTHPELLVFQSRTKMIARKDQGAFLSWLLKAPLDGEMYTKLLFEFEAGGGKGTFFTPIIKKQARRKGLFPVSTSPASLYQVERKKQRTALKRAYKLNLQVLELALTTHVTGKDFKWIYETLVEYSAHDTLKIIPEVYYALDLKYQMALEIQKVEQVRYLSLILDLFKEKCAGFIDEGRLNLSPFTQAKIGIGKQTSLPAHDHKLFISIFKALTYPKYHLKDGRRVCDVVQLTENKQAMMSKKDTELVRQFLISHLSHHSLLSIPEEKRSSIQSWWLNPDTAKPKWLEKHIEAKTNQVRLIVEAAEYFRHFYAFTMHTVGQMRHINSIRSDEEIDVPAKQRKPTRAYFEEPYIALILTIQGTLQRGLTHTQCAKLIDLLQKTRSVELTSMHRSPTEAKFLEWMKTETIQLSDLSSKNSLDIELIYQAVRDHPSTIFWYLEKAVLHQVTYSKEQLIATPQHFLNAFKMCTIYSAILGPTEAYGFYPPEDVRNELLRQNAAFASHVVHQLSAKENHKMHTFESFASPLEFFRNLWKTDRALFKELRMLIDVGGMLRDFATEEIGSAFFTFIRELDDEAPAFDGIVLFQDSAAKSEESDLMIWLKEWDKPIVLPEGDIVSGLAALGYAWKDLKLLTLIDPSHATGSDILQEEDATALLLLGENLALGDLIQGVMRLRGFLKNQTIVWGILKTLATQIEEALNLPCSAETILFWVLNNEATTQEKEILLSAYQQIDFIVQKPARAYLKKYRDDPEKQIKVWHQLRTGFVKSFKNDPLVRFGQSFSLEKTGSVLASYAQEAYESYHYPTSWEKATDVHAELKQVIKTTEAKIKKIPTTPLNELNRETHMQCEQHLKKEQEKNAYADLSPEKLPPLEDKVHIYQPGFVNYLTNKEFAQPASTLFGSKYFSENLYYSNRLVYTARSGAKPLGHTYLKPAQYLLVIYEQEELKVIAISDEEADFFHKQLIGGDQWLKAHGQKKAKINRKIALFTASGFLTRNGPKKLAFSDSELGNLTTKHTWFKEVICDIGLLACQMRDLSTFVSRAEKWKDLPHLWGQIKSWQPHPESLNTHTIDTAIVKASSKKKGSFFSSWF